MSKYVQRNTWLILAMLTFMMGYALPLRSQVPYPKNFHLPLSLPDTLSVPRGNFVSDISVDPVTHHIWIATDKGPCVSVDDGKTWISFYGQGSFIADSADCVAIAAKNNFIVVSSGTSQLVNGSFVPFGTGIHVSSNGGASWTHYQQPMDQPGDSILPFYKSTLHAYPWTTNTQNISYSIGIQGSDTIWIASFAAGIRKSTDAGKTWIRVILPNADLTSIDTNTVYHFEVTPVQTDSSPGYLNYEGFSTLIENDSTIWVGTADGINRSTDRGIQWQKFNAFNSNVTGDFVVDLRLRLPGQVWASTGQANPTESTGISYTTDDGTTWFRASEIVHDTGLYATVLVHKLAFNGQLIYAANDLGIWRSSDNGVTWITPAFIDNPETHEVTTNTAMQTVGVFDSTVFIGTSDCLVSTTDSLNIPIPFSGPWNFYCFAEPVSNTETNTYSYPSPFQPTQEVTRIRYLVTGEEQVTIEIFDFRMRLVRTVIRDVVREGTTGTEFKEIWDGTDNYGHRVPNATYFYKVTIGSTPHWGKIVVIR